MAAEEEERMAEQEERAEEERAAAEEERAAAEEERAALAAIFCGPGEWEVLGRSETRGSVCRVRTTAEGPSGPDTPLELVFHLPAGYPACPPGVSVGSERLTRAQCAALRDQLLEQARAFPPEPMVHQLVLWAQQNLRHLLAPPGSGAGPGGCATAGPGEAEAPWTALVRLDHMRAKASYTRTLRHWASALGLAGRLLFAGRVILLLLQGPRDRVKRGKLGAQSFRHPQTTSCLSRRSSWCCRGPPRWTWTRVGGSAERGWPACCGRPGRSRDTPGSWPLKSKSFRRWTSCRRSLKLQDSWRCSPSWPWGW
ncbi:RWD domain-containing protein 3 isoform X1 [Pipistrellus kuhlii]|uniref:RWD domain-containing protein 3 isoform X1 n=1 Tax=Pipistrellus kuhlii TaxID=59472 RepID=UPI001E273005|nr:RWD domain-containing protein 3 isoform X1 [Pipistrellus kuhlii]